MKSKIFILLMVLFLNCFRARKAPFDLSSPSLPFGFVLINFLNASNTVSIGGKITGFTIGELVIKNNSNEIKLSPTSSYSLSVSRGSSYKIDIQKNPSTFACSIQNAEGTANSNISNIDITCSQSASPSAVYSPSNWNDYVKNNGTDRFNASNTPCTGSESGNYYQACIHAGEVRKFQIDSKNSCTNLTAIDSAKSNGAFYWTCKVENSKAVFYSTKLKETAYLSDLIDWTSTPKWKNIKLQIYMSNSLFLETPETEWWTNPIINNEDGPYTSGTIYTFTASQLNASPINPGANLNFINIGADKIALVGKPFNRLFRNAPNVTSPLIQINTANIKFIWIEGLFDSGFNDGGFTNTSTTRFIVLKNFLVQNSSQNTGTPSIASISLGGQKNLIESSSSTNGKQQGLSFQGTSTENIVQNFNSSNHTFNGIHILSSTNQTLINSLALNNETRGLLLQSGANSNKIINLTAVNNDSSGLEFANSNQNLIQNILSMNNSTTGIQNQVSSDAILLNSISSNNNTSALLAQITASTVGTYTNNRWTGILKLSGTSLTACNAAGSASGIGYTVSCGLEGTSDFTSSFNLDLINTIFTGNAKVSSDTSNSNFSTGTFSYSTNIDISSFQNRFRAIGKTGGVFPDLTNSQRGNCTSGSCQVWDLSLSRTDTVARNVNSCPTSSSIIVYGSNTFLRNAYEILGDGIGNENALCESNENCIYTPNIGFYQGHGELVSASTTTSTTNTCSDITTGSISNIKLFKFETNGF
jgi:hypothetical protein